MRKNNWFIIKNDDDTFSYTSPKTMELVHGANYEDLPAYYKHKAIVLSWVFAGGTCRMHTGKDINNQRNKITGLTRTVYSDSGRVVAR
jgi:hypothetical protein